MTDEVYINKIARDFGISLADFGVGFVRSATKNNPLTKVGYGTIKTNMVTAGINCSTSELDSVYQTAAWPLWEELLSQAHIILGKMKWTENIYDCDDFARAKKALMSLLFGLTDMGEVYGKVYDKETDEFEWYHYFNVAITASNQVYLHESITGESVLVKKGEPMILGDWRYEFLSARF